MVRLNRRRAPAVTGRKDWAGGTCSLLIVGVDRRITRDPNHQHANSPKAKPDICLLFVIT
jgi:hypothetical protein